jgi:hypothetical protein
MTRPKAERKRDKIADILNKLESEAIKKGEFRFSRPWVMKDRHVTFKEKDGTWSNERIMKYFKVQKLFLNLLWLQRNTNPEVEKVFKKGKPEAIVDTLFQFTADNLVQK